MEERCERFTDCRTRNRATTQTAQPAPDEDEKKRNERIKDTGRRDGGRWKRKRRGKKDRDREFKIIEKPRNYSSLSDLLSEADDYSR